MIKIGKLFLFTLCAAMLVFASCTKEAGAKGDTGAQGPQGAKGDNGTDGYTSLVKIIPFAANASCPNGGLTVKSGIDKNKNNVLDSTEIDQSQNVCNGSNTGYDKQIIIPLVNASTNTTSRTPVIVPGLIKFNKTYYGGVDSIILVANPYVGNKSNSSIMELYNITDNTPVAASILTSNSLFSFTNYIQTGNLYQNLPSKEVMLGIRLHSSTEGQFAGTGGTCYLILYRH